MNKKNFILLALFLALTMTVSNAKQTQTFKQYSVVPATSTQNAEYNTDYNQYYSNTNISANYDQAPQQQYYAQPSKANKTATLHGRVVMIPANVSIPAVTTAGYSTENLQPGESFNVTLVNAFNYNGTDVAPAGSIIQGIVIQAQSAGHATKNATLEVKFTSIITPYGQSIPISGKIKTDDNTGIIYGGTKKDSAKTYAKDIGIGTGAGAVAGTVLGALAGGSVGMGAVYGTAIGAGVGLAKSLWDKGGNVVIPANSCIDVVLDQPATYTPAQYY